MGLFARHTSQLPAVLLLFMCTLLKNAGTQASSGGCSTPTLSVAKGSIPDSDITASSELNSNSSAFHGRLGNTKAWIPNSNGKHPWIQVNLKYRRNITAIATQGLQGSYVKWYYVSYGDDRNTWRNYTVQGIIKIKGNVDDTKSETVVFSPSILAQYIRLHPTNCSNKCALRFEVYGCNITTGLPGQPPPPTANSVSMHVIDISWTAPSDTGAGITGYNVQWQVVGKITKKQKVVTGSRTAKLDVTPYTEYDIQVRAYSGKGRGPWSRPLQVRSKESVPSAAPGNFKLTSSSSLSLDVSWDAIPEEQRQGKLLGYYVYFKIKGSAAEQNKTVGPAQLTLKLTQLENEIYVVRVAGYTAVGVGKSTAELNKIPNEGAPTPPRNFKLVVESSKSIRASWLEPLKFNGLFRRYVVMYGKVRGKLDGRLYTQRTAYLLTPLEEFTEYFVQVYAETSVSRASSNIEQAKTFEDAPSSPPVINSRETKAEDAHTIRVKWNEINKKDQNGIILGYFVYYKEIGQLKTSNEKTTATNAIIIGLKPFTEYCIKVTGYTKVGASPEGNCFFVKTLKSGPSHPQNVEVRAMSSVSIHVRWDEPAFPNGTIKEYIISYGTSKDYQPFDQTVTGNTMECVLDGLNKFTTYFIKVRGKTTEMGNASKILNTTTYEDIPSQPRDVTAKLVNDAIVVTWKEPQDHNGILTRYKVFCEGTRDYNSSFKINIQVVEAVSSRRSVIKKDELKPGTEYSVYVKATTVKGDGAGSDPVVLQTPSKAPPPPLPPRVVEDDVTPTTITISLTPSSDRYGKIIVHQVIVEMVGKVSKREADSVPEDIFGYKEAQANGDRFYIAAQFDRGELPVEFILGNGKIYGGYENAPLRPETRYKAYLRGVTEHNGKWLLGQPAAIRLPLTDSTMSTRALDGGEQARGKDNSSSVVIVLASSTAVLFVALLIFAAFFLFWRRKQRRDAGNVAVDRNQPDDNDHDDSSLNPANAARQLGFIDEAETGNSEHGEECRYAMLTPRTMMVPGDSSYASLEKFDKGDSAIESSKAKAAIPLLQPDDEPPTYVNQMRSPDYENI